MAIILKHTAGQYYQLSLTPTVGIPHSAIEFARQSQSNAVDFFNNISLSLPDTWDSLYRALYPHTVTQNGDTAIIQQLANALASRQLFLIQSLPPHNTGASVNTSMPSQAPPVIVRQMGTGVPNEKDTEHTFRRNQQREPETIKLPDDDNAIESTDTDSTPRSGEHETGGEPISMITGEELLRLEDAVLPGSVPFIWSRFYRSSHCRDTGLGHGWTHSAGERLELRDQTVVLTDDEGRHVNFERPALYQRSKLINEGLDLDFESKDCFILKQLNHWDKVFRRLGNSPMFRLSQLRQSNWRAAVSASRGERGYALTLRYNAQDALIEIQSNQSKSLLFSRDNRGRITRVELLNHNTEAQKTLAEYDYDQHGDLIAQRNAAGVGEHYHYSNHVITQRTLVTGFRYYFEWDRFDTQARCLRNWGDHGIYNTRFQWDAENNASCVTDSRGFTTTYVYNEFGLIDQKIDAEGGIHRYEYDQGRKKAYTDPQGATTHYLHDRQNHAVGSRDALGHHHQMVSYFNGHATVLQDENGGFWKQKFNFQGQLTLRTDPYGRETRYEYHAQGWIKQITDADGHSTRYVWNDDAELTDIIDPQGNRQQFAYDDWGQIKQSRVKLNGQSEFVTTYYRYTATGQLDTIIAPDGTRTSYRYNHNDQLIEFNDPQGRITQFDYDGLSQVCQRINPDGSVLHYAYDSERNLTRLTNENGESYRFVYDGNERLIKEIGFDGRVQRYGYNKADYLIQHIDAETVCTEFERDALGQMIRKTSRHLQHPQHAAAVSVYRYDGNGRLIETNNLHQQLTFNYHKLGHLENEYHLDLRLGKTNSDTRNLDTGIDIDYGMTGSGLRHKITLPDGQCIHYDYNTTISDQLESIKLNDSLLTHIQRDAIGRETLRHQGELTTFSDYDPMGRLKTQQAFNRRNKQSIIQREYGYDQFSNLNHLKDGTHETQYVYDVLDRLKRTEGECDEKFAFDPAGNLLSMSEHYQHPQQTKNKQANSKGNRLTLQGDRKFEYDERGNLIKETRGKGGKLITLFEYNLQNQLVTLTKDGQTTTYKYDPLGRRIEKNDTFGTTTYLWAENQLVQETRNNIKKTYIYEPYSFKPVALVQDGEVYHYHLDHLGTPRELTNEQGKIVWKVRYTTYGNVALKETEEIENNLRFQGQYFDEESGLHYNRHRYYNPNTGQFTSQDPIGLLGGINHYQYAPNPTGWVDPFGLCKEQSNRPSTSPVEGDEKRVIQYFSKTDINHRKIYGGETYDFYLGDINAKPLELARTTVDTNKKSLEFYINNRFNDGILLKGENFGITNEILTQSIAIYTEEFGEAPNSLDGSIIKKNLSNFQTEFSKIKISNPKLRDDVAAEMAIKKISFGKERVKLGYSDITVKIKDIETVEVDGETLEDVPTTVKIVAKNPEK